MICENTSTDPDALWIVKEALNDLILRFTLAGLSLLGEAVEVCERKGTGSLSTDGRRIYYDPRWMRKIWKEKSPIYASYDLLHEWLHVFYNHVLRRGDRDGRVWNEACDIFVVMEASTLLGVPAPRDGVQPKRWAATLTVEEIYERLLRDPGEQQSDENETSDFLYDEAEEHSAEAETQFYQQFTAELQTAVAVAQSFNSQQARTSKATQQRLVELTQKSVPWGRLLRGNLVSLMGNDYVSYARPNRKHLPNVILPTAFSHKERTLVILVDVSASVQKPLLNAFAANIAPAAARAQETIIITFDSVIREEIRTRRPRTVLKTLKFSTGAHYCTDIRPCFARVDKLNPSACVGFTDGYIQLPDKKYPKTLWVLPENGRPQPWGRNYHMRITW